MPSPSPNTCFFGDRRRLYSPPCLLLLVVVVLGTTSCWCSAEARRNVITHIKGFDGPLPFHLETGYVEVDEEHDVRLFYYFIESERKPTEDPLILWISSGPGCSALSGLLFEIGPLKFDVGLHGRLPATVLLQRFLDTTVSNVIFADAPVGTGFSYAWEEAGYNVTLTGSGQHLHTFLRKWLAEHEEFASNPLYIGGDSSSGLTVPVTAMDIANNRGNDHQDMMLNLKGYLVGNAVTEHRYDRGGRVPFLHGMGLISEELHEAAWKGCGGDFYNMPDQSNARCANALRAIDSVTSDINPVHILEPFCGLALRDPGISILQGHGEGRGRRSMLVRDNVEHPEFFSRRKLNLPVECRDNGYRLSYIWADDPEVRAALGIHDGSIGSWTRCTNLTHFSTDLDTVIPHHVNLTKAGYRALVYSGDHDLDVTFVGTQAWIRSLKYPIFSDWRPWHYNRQVAGFTRTYAYNLTDATVKGAGHTAPEYKPKECLDMLDRWMSPAGQL